METYPKGFWDATAAAKSFADYQATIKEYSAARRGKDGKPEDALKILKRLNGIWDLGQPNRWGANMPGHAHSLSGDQGVQQIEQLIYYPIVYRMNFLRQLSTTYLDINLDGAHNRLAHSLGTVQCAWKMLCSIEKNDDLFIEDTPKKAVLVAALIHDCFEGPLGHSLELMRYELTGAEYRRLDKHFLLEALADDESLLCKAIHDVFGTQGAEIIRYVQMFFDYDVLEETSPDSLFLAQIIDSAIDADRIDYVLRDSRHLDIQGITDRDIERLIERISVKPGQDKEMNEPKAMRRLCFHIDHKDIVEQFMAHRRRLYREIYENPRKLAVDEMFIHAIYYVLDSRDLFPIWETPKKTDTIASQVAAELVKLVDDHLMQFLLEMGHPLHAMELLRDILLGHFYRPVYVRGLPLDKLDSAEEKVQQVEKAFAEAVDRERKTKYPLGTPRHILPVAEKCAEIYRSLTSDSKWWTEHDSLYMIEELFSGGFTNKHQFEQVLWTTLMSDGAFSSAFKQYVQEKYGHAAEEMYELLKGVPHVYISVPSYFVPVREEAEEYAKEPLRQRVCYYHDRKNDASIEFKYPDLPTKKNHEHFYIVASACPFLANREDTQTHIVNELKRLLYTDKAWLEQKFPHGPQIQQQRQSPSS